MWALPRFGKPLSSCGCERPKQLTSHKRIKSVEFEMMSINDVIQYVKT